MRHAPLPTRKIHASGPSSPRSLPAVSRKIWYATVALLRKKPTTRGRPRKARKNKRRGPDVELELEDTGPNRYRAHMSSKDFFAPMPGEKIEYYPLDE